MIRFLLRRAAAVVVVLFAVMTVTWAMLHLLYPEPWAFDTRPLVTQFATYVADAVRLDLGTSWDQQRNSVSGLIAQGLPADLWLLGGGLVIGCTVGLAAGAYSASRPSSVGARILDLAAALALIAPVYWVGLMLLLVFANGFGLVPLSVVRVNDYAGPLEDPLRFLAAIWLPWLVLAAPLAAVVTRMARAATKETLRDDYVRTARAKGLTQGRVVRRHALPAAASPVMTLVGTQMATLMTNLVLVEIVFGVPGIYSDVRRAMTSGNLPLLQGLTVVTALLVVLATVVVDTLQALLDPTVREA